MVCKVGLMLALLALPTPALADWVHISTSKNGVNVFYETETVKLGKGTAQVWIKLKPSEQANYPFAEAVALWKIDCVADTQATLSATSYGAKGEVRETMTKVETPELYEPIVPGSYGHTISRKMCPRAMAR